MKLIKKYKYEIISFLVPVLIFAIAGSFSSTFPFGNMSLMTYDGASQHPGLLVHFLEVIKGNASLFYSFNGGLGYNFYTTIAYYLLSPLNLFALFFDVAHLHYFYNISILVKIGLCGLTMFSFLNYRYDGAGKNFLLSLCYSLMAYNIIYFSNYMWIDSVIMLPLVALGIEKLLKEQKRLPYLLSLTAAIFFNFYIGYMICIFSLIYFFYRYFLIEIKSKDVIKDFFILSVLSALILSFVLIPVFFDLLKGKATMFKNASYFVFKTDGFKSLYKMTVGSYSVYDISYGLPNIYTSLFVIILNVFYYMNNSISKKEKITSLAITLFFFLCLSFNLLDYAWQMFQAPIWYPGRYTFIISFFLITVAGESFFKLKSLKVRKSKLVIAYLILFLIITASMLFVKNGDRMINLGFLIGSFVLMILYYLFRKKAILLTILLITELLTNTAYTLNKIPFSVNMREKTVVMKKSVEEIEKIKETEDSLFYRIEKSPIITHNDGALLGYNGVTFFNSMRNARIINFMENYVGVTTDNVCRINYTANNPILNSLFGIKYIISNEELGYYRKKSEEVYENFEILPLAFTVSMDIYDTEIFEGETVENYNKIMNDISRKKIDGFSEQTCKLINYKESEQRGEKVFKQSETGYNKITYEGVTTERGFLYLNNLEYIKKLGGKLYINEIEYDIRNSFIYLEKNSSWTLIIESDKVSNMPYQIRKKDVDVYFLKESDYNEFVLSGQENGLEITDYSSADYIEAKMDLEEDSVAFTTIPYDDSWTIYVDGKKQDIVKIYDTFLGLKLKKGSHTITFKYFPKGLRSSLVVSVMGISIAILYVKKRPHD